MLCYRAEKNEMFFYNYFWWSDQADFFMRIRATTLRLMYWKNSSISGKKSLYMNSDFEEKDVSPVFFKNRLLEFIIVHHNYPEAALRVV